MRFSVWNQGLGAFDYYESDEQQHKLNVEKPKHLPNRPLGATVSQAAWPLPASARKVGGGTVAIGRIASRSSGTALGDITDLSLPTVAILAGAGYLAWKYFGRKR